MILIVDAGGLGVYVYVYLYSSSVSGAPSLRWFS
jgi:hypothetical protein